MNRRKLLKQVTAKPTNVRFAEILKLAEGFGFKVLRISGSHHILGRPGISEQINFQQVGGQAKPYQSSRFFASSRGII